MAQRLPRGGQYERPYPSYPSLDFSTRSQAHSINLITEDFLSGYQHDGRMSVIRRFFCLFVTFDLVFIALLWLICVMITGDNIYNALRTQVIHYTIYTSLFDIVMAAICRFVILILFYAILYINHWIIIAASTSGSCAFLISKVFVYDWADSPQPVFQVLLVVVSFVIAWGEAWFLDCRVIPQEQHARRYLSAITSTLDDRNSLLPPFLAASTGTGRRTESIANFYSPYESIHNSDDEVDAEEDYKKMALECVKRAYDLIESEDWEVEKVTSSSDTIQSIKRDRLGKVYKLTGRVNANAQKLVEDLFNNIEEMPKWNPTLLESRVIHHIDPRTDISYQVSAPGGGGFVKSRDFVNLRSWEIYEDGQLVPQEQEDILYPRRRLAAVQEHSEGESSIKSEPPRRSEDEAYQKRAPMSLSKSLGAKDFGDSPMNSSQENVQQGEGDAKFCDAQDWPSRPLRVFVSAAIAVEYPGYGATSKYVRGENLISCYVTREVQTDENSCIFEWLLCLDLKGYIPKSILDAAYTTMMQDFMKHLRSYCENKLKD